MSDKIQVSKLLVLRLSIPACPTMKTNWTTATKMLNNFYTYPEEYDWLVTFRPSEDDYLTENGDCDDMLVVRWANLLMHADSLYNRVYQYLFYSSLLGFESTEKQIVFSSYSFSSLTHVEPACQLNLFNHYLDQSSHKGLASS